MTGRLSAAGLAPGEVARRLGVSVTTLRSWHRRYGLGPSGHEPGTHRRYTGADLARLEVMRRLTGLGVGAAEAAEIALRGPASSLTPRRRAGRGPAPAGRALPEARGLTRAAMRLDAGPMLELLRVAIRDRGVVATWDRVIRPVLTRVGQRHTVTQRLIDVEHLLSRSITEALAAVPRPPARSAPAVLLACAAEEQHGLPLEALAAALAERGCASRLLGPRVPRRALLDALRRIRPTVVVVWSQLAATADPTLLRAIGEHRPRPAVVLAAGPGWQRPGLPPGVEHPADLAGAVALVLSVT